jgi:site-specific DNA recombinase
MPLGMVQTRHARAASQRRGLRGSPGGYVLKGLVYCRLYQRRTHGEWVNDRAYYRCRFPREYALANHFEHPRNVYLRQDQLLASLDGWLAQAFSPSRLNEIIRVMHEAQADDHPTAQRQAARQVLEDCHQRLARYRAALEAGADPVLVTQWIAEAQADRAAAQAQLSQAAARRRMTHEQISSLVAAFGDLSEVIKQGDPADKAEVYRQLGLHLIYEPKKPKVRAQTRLDPHSICIGVPSVSVGDLNPHPLTRTRSSTMPRSCQAMTTDAVSCP